MGTHSRDRHPAAVFSSAVIGLDTAAEQCGGSVDDDDVRGHAASVLADEVAAARRGDLALDTRALAHPGDTLRIGGADLPELELRRRGSRVELAPGERQEKTGDGDDDAQRLSPPTRIPRSVDRPRMRDPNSR